MVDDSGVGPPFGLGTFTGVVDDEGVDQRQIGQKPDQSGDVQPLLAFRERAADDQILDIDLTPNRGDCFCVTGIAREIAAAQGAGMPIPEVADVDAVNDDTFEPRAKKLLAIFDKRFVNVAYYLKIHAFCPEFYA